MDDIVDTAGTQVRAAVAALRPMARPVLAYCTHPVLSGAAIERLNDSDLDELVVADTIPLSDDALACPRIRQLSVADLLAETIRRISNEESVSSLCSSNDFSSLSGRGRGGFSTQYQGVIMQFELNAQKRTDRHREPPPASRRQRFRPSFIGGSEAPQAIELDQTPSS